MQLEHNEKKKQRITLTELFSMLDITDLNIYSQAYLEMESPFIKINRPQVKSHHELCIEFKLTGELNAKVHCLIDTYKKEIPKREAHFFRALCIESMNILIGHILTQIKNVSQINLSLSHPTFRDLNQASEFNNDNTNTLSAVYKLNSYPNEYDCRIIFEFQKDYL